MQKVITLGELITDEQQKDAVHIAVAPVIANERLTPGENIGFVEEGNTELVGVVNIITESIGIVDPFLTQMVYINQRFFMFLYPNTITSLRHDWTHSAFKVKNQSQSKERRIAKEKANKYFNDIAENVGIKTKSLLRHIGSCLDGGEVYVEYGSTQLKDAYFHNIPLFWHNYELATGESVIHSDKTLQFSFQANEH